MTTGLHLFSAVAREVWCDNLKTIETVILRGRERVLNVNDEYLASHYRFNPRACMPARGPRSRTQGRS
ncbi:MAG: Transposase [Phycisphaerales bacterium]|nr:Transposase [Phycisphaerales bacterium]